MKNWKSIVVSNCALPTQTEIQEDLTQEFQLLCVLFIIDLFALFFC